MNQIAFQKAIDNICAKTEEMIEKLEKFSNYQRFNNSASICDNNNKVIKMADFVRNCGETRKPNP